MLRKIKIYMISLCVMFSLFGYLSSHLVKTTTSTYAKLQTTWSYKMDSKGSCYLIQEINYNNKKRLEWRF